MKKVLTNISKFFLGVLLLVVSIILLAITFPWGIIEMLIKIFWKKRFWKGLGILGELILLFAIIVDIFGNVVMQVPFNRILITKEGYKFGSRFDTISYVLGHAFIHGNLTKTGKVVCKALDALDEDHCAKTYYGREAFNS